MKRTVDYSTLAEPLKTETALRDFEEYCGKDYYRVVLNTVKHVGRDEMEIGLALFAGIEGFPVTAFLDKHYGPKA